MARALLRDGGRGSFGALPIHTAATQGPVPPRRPARSATIWLRQKVPVHGTTPAVAGQGRGELAMDDVPPGGPRRCALVVNPIKVSEGFRGLATERLAGAGWAEPLWLETSEEDPGHGMTREALAAEVDLVIGAGGDGTVRIVAGELAGSHVPMGVVAAGTANLLARNLDLPLTEPEALDVALALHTRDIDLIELTVDGSTQQRYAVMAGVGVDAMIMDEVNPDLKATVGPAAYFLAAGKALGRLPMRVELSV